MTPHHVGYIVKNMEAAIAEFEALGYRIERPVGADPGRGVNIAFLRNGAYRVELVCPDGKESPLYPLLKRFKNAPYHICYKVDDLEESITELAGKGYTVMEEPKPAPCIDGLPVAFLIHRHMGIIELVEMKVDQWN